MTPVDAIQWGIALVVWVVAIGLVMLLLGEIKDRLF